MIFLIFFLFKSSSHRVEHKLLDKLILSENLSSEYLDGFVDFFLQLFQAADLIVTDSAHHQDVHIIDFAEFRY